MQITSNHATLLWLETRNVAPSLWSKLVGMLDNAEREQADRFKFARDRDDYIVSHTLTRGALTLLTGRSPSSWAFTTGKYGKPEAICSPGTPTIRINSTHTHGLAAVAAILDHDIGCDAERVSSNAPLNIADDYFSPAECADLGAMRGSAAHERFYALWTLKEAYAKAIGRGLTVRLDSVRFRFNPFTASFSDEAGDEPRTWYFERYSPSPAYVLALAVQHPTPTAVTVTARAVDVQQLLAAVGDLPS